VETRPQKRPAIRQKDFREPYGRSATASTLPLDYHRQKKYVKRLLESGELDSQGRLGENRKMKDDLYWFLMGADKW
jgi:hypothetical protein